MGLLFPLKVSFAEARSTVVTPDSGGLIPNSAVGIKIPGNCLTAGAGLTGDRDPVPRGGAPDGEHFRGKGLELEASVPVGLRRRFKKRGLH